MGIRVRLYVKKMKQQLKIRSAEEMAVMMINRRGRLEWWNAAAETLLEFQITLFGTGERLALIRDVARR